MKKKILITGSAGFIGRCLVEKLNDTGQWDVFALDRQKTGLENEIVMDFCDPDFKNSLEALPKMDAIVHLGAKVDFKDPSREDLLTANVVPTVSLADLAKRTGAYFIFASTAIICGARNTHITAQSKPDPDTEYAYSKWLAEEKIRAAGIKHLMLRISGVFGQGGPQHLSLNKAISNAIKGEVPVIYGDGSIRRSYIYVKDFADIILDSLDKKFEGVHLTAGSYDYSVEEMLREVCNVLLPGEHPLCHEGKPGTDQVVEPSPVLLKGRTFQDAIKDIAEAVK